MHVLILEDTRAGAAFLKNLLKKNQIEADVCRNGKEGLEFLKDHEVDCVLLDLLMPEMDGIEFLEELQKLETAPPTIVVSSNFTENKRNRCFSLGAKAVLTKPYKEDEIIGTLSSLKKGT